MTQEDKEEFGMDWVGKILMMLAALALVVIPVVSPTVPSAEAHSNMDGRIGSPSILETIMVPVNRRVM